MTPLPPSRTALRTPPPRGSGRRPTGRRRAGFTLFELMVVIGILGIIATISMPSLVSSLRKRPMRQATDDLLEACRHARLKAVIEGRTAEIVIEAGSGNISVRSAPSAGPAGGAGGAAPAALPEPAPAEPDRPRGDSVVRHGKVADRQWRLPETVAFKELTVNLRDMMEHSEARIRFYPDGTCDALDAVLFSEQNEERRIRLEITTGRDILEVIR